MLLRKKSCQKVEEPYEKLMRIVNFLRNLGRVNQHLAWNAPTVQASTAERTLQYDLERTQEPNPYTFSHKAVFRPNCVAGLYSFIPPPLPICSYVSFLTCY